MENLPALRAADPARAGKPASPDSQVTRWQARAYCSPSHHMPQQDPQFVFRNGAGTVLQHDRVAARERGDHSVRKVGKQKTAGVSVAKSGAERVKEPIKYSQQKGGYLRPCGVSGEARSPSPDCARFPGGHGFRLSSRRKSRDVPPACRALRQFPSQSSS